MVVSILAVIISRLVTFQPGLVYGFVASAVVVAPITLNRRNEATLVLIPAVGLIVVSVLAWLLLGPVRAAAAGGAWAPGLAETVLAMIVIGGLETLFVTMIPLRFLDGATVMSWSRLAWALTFGTVTFLWWQLLLNQDHAYIEAMEQTNVQVVLGTVVVFMLTTGGLWSYFRFRPSRAEEAGGLRLCDRQFGLDASSRYHHTHTYHGQQSRRTRADHDREGHPRGALDLRRR